MSNIEVVRSQSLVGQTGPSLHKLFIQLQKQSAELEQYRLGLNAEYHKELRELESEFNRKVSLLQDKYAKKYTEADEASQKVHETLEALTPAVEKMAERGRITSST